MRDFSEKMSEDPQESRSNGRLEMTISLLRTAFFESRSRFARARRELAATSAMSPYIDDEYLPGRKAQSDEALLDFLRANSSSIFHPVGTCKMGCDADSVVDERLRVRGVSRLRVADASIMPTLISGNTNAPSIMIGEKAADMILADALANLDILPELVRDENQVGSAKAAKLPLSA
jgi:choline dehydrogenase